MKKLLLSVALLAGFAGGMRSQSLHFDGSDDNVSSGSLLLSSTSNVTMEAWVYPEFNGGTNQRIIYNGNSSLNGYGIYLSNGRFGVLFGGIAFNDTYYYPDMNRWCHVALVQEGVEWKFYVDGVLQAEFFNGPAAPAGITTIGGDVAGGEVFSGKIDEVRLWNVARTENEILQNFHCSLSAQTGLIANYVFDDGVANANNTGIVTLTDYSGNNNNMTLNNFALAGTTSNWVDDATIHDADALVEIFAMPISVPASGGTVNFTTMTQNTGDAPLYQWYKNGVLIAGATGGSYTGFVNPNDYVSCMLTSSNVCITNQVDNDTVLIQQWASAAALGFDGNDDYVSVPGAVNIPVANNNYTIEAWIRPEYMGDFGIVGWGNYGADNEVNALRLSSNGIVNYWWNNDNIVSTADLSGEWHHVAATYDGTDRNIYLDGVLISTDNPAVASHNVPNASNLTIGVTNGWEYFPGIIDEVRIWNIARSEADINANMNCNIVPQTGLVAYYDFNQGIPYDDNSGIDTLLDKSGNNNNGLLNNFWLNGSPSNWVESQNYTYSSATISADNGPYITPGTMVNFTAVPINGGSTPSYQWMVNGVNAGTNSSTFSTNSLANEDEVTCVVTSSNPCVTNAAQSNILNFTILPPNSIPYSDNCYVYGDLEFCDPVSEDNGYYYNALTGLYGVSMNDASILSTSQGDAYDGAFEVVVADTAFTNATGAYIDTLNNVIQTAKQTINGVRVSREFKFYTSKPIVRVRVQLHNPGNTTVTTPVNIFSNLGSDSNTYADTSSNGTDVLDNNTRWMITWDTDLYEDPVLTWARFGKGNIASQPAFVSQPDEENDNYEETFNVVIPPHTTKYIVMFNRLDSTTGSARNFAPFFDNLQLMITDSMFVGIDSLDNIVNWSFAKPVPAFTTTVYGCDTLSVAFANNTAGTNTYSWNFGDASPSSAAVNPVHVYTAGNYTVALTATGENGFDSTVVQNVSVQAPDFGTSLSGVTITANNASALAYQWVNCDSAYAVIPGATGQSYTATANGNYAVIITTAGCADTSACVAVNGVGIKNLTGTAVMVYPNPASDMLSIKLPAANRNGKIEIVDVTGRVVYTAQVAGTETTIRVAELSAGVYQLRVNSNGNTYKTKFVKQ